MILTDDLLEELDDIAAQCINIFHKPVIERRKGSLKPWESIHFIYPLSRIAGNAADAGSLVSMQAKLSELLNREMGTVWVGIYGDTFHVWAAYKDTPHDA